MRRKAIAAGVALALAGCATTPTDPQRPRVALDTSAGRIVLALDAKAAPVSSCNFIGYAVFGDYAGGSFFRTVVRATNTASPNPIDVIRRHPARQRRHLAPAHRAGTDARHRSATPRRNRFDGAGRAGYGDVQLLHRHRGHAQPGFRGRSQS